MADPSSRELYFSFFMFTTDLRPDDEGYREVIIRHIKELKALGYVGFDLPIAPTPALDHRLELDSYRALKRALDAAGLSDVHFTTNVAATRTFDPTSLYKEQRDVALAYLKARVDITAALGARIMAGPIIFPYNLFPTTDSEDAIWSDALQEWVIARYRLAQPVLGELAQYAQERDVLLAIEPVDHWETAAPNMVAEVMDFLEGVPSKQIGVCVDSAHVVLGSDGPAAFAEEIRRCAQQQRIGYVHISAPDRGAVHDSWIPWKLFLGPILAGYDGPLLIECFNAIPAFHNPLHLTRRKFWIPGEDTPVPGQPDAYTVAGQAIAAVRRELSECDGS